ncbi:MAG: exodeoxyribonuclease VII large subunit [Rhizobacter sp.]|nr:exodeoxyribonuclease VII large subunit [Rhizobacter sp.]
MGEPLIQRGERLVWGVAGLVHAVSDALAARFSACTVRGELSGFSRAASGHCYLSLKDADGGTALIRCAMFRRAASLLDFTPADGQLVEVRGRLAVYEPRGELQFVVESMQRAGAGALFEQFLRLRARLEAEGLFDESRKRPLPRFPRRVGVVTSLGAAALHDVLTALARRAPHVEVVLYPSLVQGPAAPGALVSALQTAGRRAEVDVLIVCRGGGSLEDLWSFNDERVVRAISACPLPVLCGVGHETDVTLADLAADMRAPTPTAAAELVSPSQADGLALLAAFAALVTRRMHHAIDSQAQRLDRATLRLMRPADVVRRHAQHLALLRHTLQTSSGRVVPSQRQGCAAAEGRLRRSADVAFAVQRQRLASLQARLAALDPRQVLARGYAWLHDEKGRPITSVHALAPGQVVRAELADGHALASVTRVVPDKTRLEGQ